MYEREFLVESYYRMYQAWEEEKAKTKEIEKKWEKLVYSQLVVNMVLGIALISAFIHIYSME